MRAFPILLAVAGVLGPGARAETWRAEPPAGRIVVHVDRKGALSAFAHDHHFEVTRWRATAEVKEREPTSVDVVLFADSLRDRQQSLSEADRDKVNGQAAGPEVLDAQRHPEIEFRSSGLDVAPGGDARHLRGTLHGTLTARGKTIPLDLAVDAERRETEWRVRGNAKLKQSDLGIEPFSGFAGTVGVKDEVRVELAVILRRAR
jgi:polyisoprenoid-binding protein YceI